MSLDAVGIISNDLGKSIQFYGLLGVKIQECGDGHYEGTTETGLRLMIDSIELIKKINPGWRDPIGSRIVLCFKQISSEEVNSIYASIVKSGFEGMKEPWDAFWGQRYASVIDPDGNQVDLFADL